MTVRVIRVEGLREVDRALRDMGDGIDKEFRAEAKGIAEVVAGDARRRVPDDGSGQAAASIKAGATAKGAYVQGGKKSVPYYGWLDFGTRRPISGRPRSVGPWKGSGRGPKQGRFIYPALKDNAGQVERRTLKAVKVARKKAGL